MRDGGGRAGRWCALLGAACLVYVLCTLLVRRTDGGEIAWLDVWFHNGLRLASGAVAFAGARRCVRDRSGWRVSAAAEVVNGTANFVWVLIFHSAALSPADALFLAYYPLMYVAVVLLARARASTRGLGQWLDGGVAGFGVAALVAAFVFPPLLTGASGGALATAVNLAYPLADLLLIAILLAGLAPAGWRPDRGLGLLIVSLLLNTVGDAMYLLQSAADHYGPASLANVIWILAFCLTAMAPFANRPAHAAKPTAPHRSRLLLPALSAVAAFGLLVFASFQRVLPVAVGLAAITLAFAGTRVALAFRELRLLANSRREARTDELTGLPNRRAFLEALDRALATADAAPISVLLLDLNGFKEVNDTLGHHSGDVLLTAVGGVLRQQLRPGDTVARLGGDEFAIVLPHTDLHAAEALAEHLRAAVNTPLDVANLSIAVGASIGVANSPRHANDSTTLLRFADIAMYQAKQRRIGVHAYEHAGDGSNRDRLELAQDVRGALHEGQIVLHYQPKVEISTGLVAGTEALARWQHPHRGLLYPDAFLPLVEQADLGHDLTRSVLGAAVGQLADWGARGVPWSVAVNISPADLLDESLPAFVAELLAAHSVAPSRLVLEITEGSLVADPVRAARTVRRLRDAGTQISLDDFGVGFSSLVHLRTLEFDELKLDRTLATELETDPRGQAIVRAAVGLAEVLGLRLVVEGVETDVARDTIAAMGARYIQGYIYTKALPADALEAWAADRAPTLPPGGPSTARTAAPAGAVRPET